MKTTISLPDSLVESADELAQRLGVSRNDLYADAVAEYLARHQVEDISAGLNKVHADEERGVDSAVRSAQARSLDSLDW